MVTEISSAALPTIGVAQSDPIVLIAVQSSGRRVYQRAVQQDATATLYTTLSPQPVINEMLLRLSYLDGIDAQRRSRQEH